MAKLTLEIYFSGQPVQAVAEETEVELRLSNRGEAALTGLELAVGRDKVRAGFGLEAGATLLLSYKVQDLAGRLTFQVRDKRQTLATVTLEVYPRKISRSELEWLKYRRLPRLLAQLDTPNTILLDYDDSPADRTFLYTSLDFTAQKLRGVCRLLLEEGLLGGLSQRLDYRVIEKPRRDEGTIRGNIRWNPTVQEWLNSPAETGLTHHWVEAPADYATRPNLLLVFWLKELIFETRKLAWQVETTGQASSQLVKGAGEFKEYAGRFEQFLKIQQHLQPVLTRLTEHPAERPAEGFNPRDPAQWPGIARDCRESFNPAYARLVEVFEEYLRRYIRLPEEGGEATGIQPLSVIYEWWCACEIAATLGLTFAPGEQGRQSGIFRSGKTTLFYNQAAPGGWYSSGRTQPARPDLRFEPDPASGRGRIFLDVKYRTAPGDLTRAHPEDMYRMLAYMNDFEVPTGVIIFPGTAPEPQLRLLERPADWSVDRSTGGSRRGGCLAELSLRPPTPDEPEVLARWETVLKECLVRLQTLP
ncbi:MAG: hypothetical protein J0I20_09735 [Chloroflexi bacterium]|nr:hypothetical protein [Chloroflexota bacterium]OJV94616.1 MAG: hypothetical protein BGO39_23080 [Chloroflexi bacterium 54-19]